MDNQNQNQDNQQLSPQPINQPSTPLSAASQPVITPQPEAQQSVQVSSPLPHSKPKKSKAIFTSVMIIVILTALGLAGWKLEGTSPDKSDAQTVGDRFVSDLQKGDIASNLETPSFQQQGDVWGEDALQQYQSEEKATSNDWSVSGTSASATYTLYISIKGNEPAVYNMKLEKVNGAWLVSDFEDSGN